MSEKSVERKNPYKENFSRKTSISIKFEQQQIFFSENMTSNNQQIRTNALKPQNF